MKPSEADIASEIAQQVARRGVGKTICPSEVARSLAGEWRDLLPDVRRVAGQMAARGEIMITQKGVPADPEHARGPIRLGLR